MKSKKSAGFFLVIIFMLVGIIFICSYWSTEEKTLVGEWEYGLRDIYSFDKDNNFKITVDSTQMNYGEYHIDLSKDPVWIDFIPKKENVVAGHYTPPLAKGILRFQDASIIEIALKADESNSIFGAQRPGNFKENGLFVFTLIKIKPEEKKE